MALERIKKIFPARIRREVQLYRMNNALRKARSQHIPASTSRVQLKISLCTTCRDRSHHLRYTLRQNLRDISGYPEAEVVVVDYGSERPLDAWILRNFGQQIRSGVLRYARVLDVAVWNASHAKNIAHNLGTGDILVNVDADNFVGLGFCEYINNVFAATPALIVAQGSGNLSCAGRIAMHHESFRMHGGYDEELQAHGFGYEDYDLVRRLEASGSKLHQITNTGYLQAFWHSDDERSVGYSAGIHDVEKSSHSNYLRSSTNIEKGLLAANQRSGWGRARLIYGGKGSELKVSASPTIGFDV